MAYTVILHILNEDPIIAEMEELPGPQSTCIAVTNPRRRDGKAVSYVDREAAILYFPWTRFTFLEILAPRRTREEVVEFFRD